MNREAEEIVSKFYFKGIEQSMGKEMANIHAKACAVIYVDGIIEAFEKIKHQIDFDNYEFIMKQYNQLKQQLTNEV